ncbi:amino acid dehydrogenase [bacterium]|nr:MAG: amino acid dehydrogenase [bacterium]
MGESLNRGEQNLQWLRENMHPYFFITMREEIDALATLASGLQKLAKDRRLILADRDKVLILACLDRPGSLYDTLRRIKEREISYTEIVHSFRSHPDFPLDLEIQKYEFDRKDHSEIAQAKKVAIPPGIREGVLAEMKLHYPNYGFDRFDRDLCLLWLNNRNYVVISPFQRIARTMWLFCQGRRHGGIYFDVEEVTEPDQTVGFRILFAAGNPPEEDFLLQIMEVFYRLGIGINRTYSLIISNGIHPYFLGTFYVRTGVSDSPARGTELFKLLRNELFNTQILSSESVNYQEFVRSGAMSGEDASLINAFIGFCHTNLGHKFPDIYELETVQRAFHAHPDIALQMAELFKARFDPDLEDRNAPYQEALEKAESAVARYRTGHRHIDEIRKNIFQCCLIFVKNTLKTNFFVLEKQALAFRLDPNYLVELDPVFTDDLPSDLPFRVTFFYGRDGFGYHIGFSDIARGGWRTILAHNQDDFTTTAEHLFKEVYVLAQTQHLKNKDIYEGGSKMAILVDARGIDEENLINQRMYKLQYGFINAFLDIYITRNGSVLESRVVDYYGEDEAIELGPDENMHDSMIEIIARLSVRRGYILGSGIISSKKAGINHKEYGVTSTGVVTFAEVTMAHLGLDMRKDPFTVKLTGGPYGDVAGNAIRILLDRCPKVRITLIVDGSGVLYDPAGASRAELRRILFKGDVESFRPSKLHPGGFLLFRGQTRKRGLVTFHRKIVHTKSGVEKMWVSPDEFLREFEGLIFEAPADLLIPAGGRPETIHDGNWNRFFPKDGPATVRVIVEGANSFLTPEARVQIQKKGVIVMRDASANKCGVISSSYEVIANLLMSDEEFLTDKERYVSDVLEILDRRARDEARLILARYQEEEGRRLYTEITDEISREINSLYARLFEFLGRNPNLCVQPLFRRALFGHLPPLIRERTKYRNRVSKLPEKYLYAILASEISSSLVYRSNREADFEDMVRGHLKRVATSKRQGNDGK